MAKLMAKFTPLGERVLSHWQSLDDGGRRLWMIAIARYWVDRVYKDDVPTVLEEILTVATMVSNGNATVAELRFVSKRLPLPYPIMCGWHCQQCALADYPDGDGYDMLFAANALRLDEGDDFLLSIAPGAPNVIPYDPRLF
jgi:hypothetical protein